MKDLVNRVIVALYRLKASYHVKKSWARFKKWGFLDLEGAYHHNRVVQIEEKIVPRYGGVSYETNLRKRNKKMKKETTA